MYDAERDAMCDSAGALTAVRYGVDPECPTRPCVIILDFEEGSWTLAVNADDDTIRIADTTDTDPLALDGLHIADAPAASPWTDALGTSPTWVWVLENQQGYEDGLQFHFARDGREVRQIQLMAVASAWTIAVVRPWEPPRDPRPATMAR